jgi:hypothetical protein
MTLIALAREKSGPRAEPSGYAGSTLKQLPCI